jgi:hypothetical protein
LETIVKDSLFPREAIAQIIDENNTMKKPSKIRLNTLINKFSTENTIKTIFAFFPTNIGNEVSYIYIVGMLESSYGEDNEDEYNTEPYLHYQTYRISNKLTSSPILQLENC